MQKDKLNKVENNAENKQEYKFDEHPRTLGRFRKDCVVSSLNIAHGGELGKTTEASVFVPIAKYVCGVQPALALNDEIHTSFKTVFGDRDELGQLHANQNSLNFVEFDVRTDEGKEKFFNFLKNKRNIGRDKVLDFGSANANSTAEIFKDKWSWINKMQHQRFIIKQFITSDPKSFGSIEQQDKEFSEFKVENNNSIVFLRYFVVGKMNKPLESVVKDYEEKFGIKVEINKPINLGDGKYIIHHVIHTKLNNAGILLQNFEITDIVSGKALDYAHSKFIDSLENDNHIELLKEYYDEVAFANLSTIYFDRPDILKLIGEMEHPLLNIVPSYALFSTSSEPVKFNKNWKKD